MTVLKELHRLEKFIQEISTYCRCHKKPHNQYERLLQAKWVHHQDASFDHAMPTDSQKTASLANLALCANRQHTVHSCTSSPWQVGHPHVGYTWLSQKHLPFTGQEPEDNSNRTMPQEGSGLHRGGMQDQGPPEKGFTTR